MFNRKLKEEVERLEEEIKEKDLYISILRKKLEAIEEYESEMPADCVYGDHCEACHFVKVFYIPRSYHYGCKLHDKILVCGRSEVCPNFVKRPDVKEEN